jgi:hypothetical protein
MPAAKARKERKDALRSVLLWPMEKVRPFFVSFVNFVVITTRPIPVPYSFATDPCHSVASVVVHHAPVPRPVPPLWWENRESLCPVFPLSKYGCRSNLRLELAK